MEKQPLYKRFAGQMGYPEKNMNPPPAEKRGSVIQLSLTEGCQHAGCTFCTMYDRRSFKVKGPQEFQDHVDEVFEYLNSHPKELRPKKRIFLGAGNALSAPFEDLLEASQYSLQKLYKARKGEKIPNPIPRRLSVYGNTHDILEKDYRSMMHLRCGGTCSSGCSARRLGEKHGVDVVYWGIESGNNDVLKIAGKGYKKEEVGYAGSILHSADIRASVMIMPGLGGTELAKDHVRDTVAVLNRVRPEWTTFIGLKINPNTPYSKRITREENTGTNRRLTPYEIALQTAEIIEGISYPTRIGVYGSDVHTFGENPVSFPSSYQVYNHEQAGALALQIRSAADRKYSEKRQWFLIK